MAFPEPERFSIKDIAIRWGRTETYVEELVRKFQFQHIILVSSRERGLPIARHYYFDHTEWLYEKNNRAVTTPYESAQYMNPDEIPEGFLYAGGYSAYIPRTALEAFEQEHGIKPTEEAIPPAKAEFRWIKSKPLRAAVEVYYDLYAQKKLKPNQAHKKQIREWLDKHFPNFSDNIKYSIENLANLDKKGGAPRGK